MKKYKNKAKLTVAATLATSLTLAAPISVFAHGWVVNDRAHLSSVHGNFLNRNMGNVAYEAQSAGEVNSRYAVEQGRVSLNDAISANGGNIGGFARMRDYGANRFHRTPMQGGLNTIQWFFTAPHRTSTIVYYISRPGFDPSRPLDFADFEYLATFNYNGNSPAPSRTLHNHNITLPTDRSGAHTIMIAWHVADNNVSWYRVKDIYLMNDGSIITPQPELPSSPTPEQPQAPEQGTPEQELPTLPQLPGSYANWNSTTVYTQGNRVIHNNIIWEAQWWTAGEEPGTTGQWGVWRERGSVAETPEQERPGQEAPELETPEQEVPEQEAPELETPEKEMPEQETPNQTETIFTIGTLFTAGQEVVFNGNVYRAAVTFVFWGDTNWLPSENSTLWTVVR